MIKADQLFKHLNIRVLCWVFSFFLLAFPSRLQSLSHKGSKEDCPGVISGQYSDQLTLIKGRHHKNSFLHLLGMDNSVSDNIYLSMTDRNTLKVDLRDKYGSCCELFKGKQKRKFSYDLFTQKLIYLK